MNQGVLLLSIFLIIILFGLLYSFFYRNLLNNASSNLDTSPVDTLAIGGIIGGIAAIFTNLPNPEEKKGGFNFLAFGQNIADSIRRKINSKVDSLRDVINKSSQYDTDYIPGVENKSIILSKKEKKVLKLAKLIYSLKYNNSEPSSMRYNNFYQELSNIIFTDYKYLLDGFNSSNLQNNLQYLKKIGRAHV